MKKLFLLVTAIILLASYKNFSSTSMPVVLEKKTMEDRDTGGMPVIRVMTYNIHRGINKDNKLDLDGIAEVIKSSGAEIIALQEVERFSVRTGFKDQIGYIADKLSMQYVFGKSINILNGQYGNAILSKHPIEECEVIKLPSEGEQRTLLRAGLNVYGDILSFYTTHLGLKQSERDMQIEEIMRIIDYDKNLLLTGDLNTKADELGAIAEELIDCASQGVTGGKVTFENEGLSERIDYIFTSKNFEIKEYDVLKSNASDHYPVICTLKIN